MAQYTPLPWDDASKYPWADSVRIFAKAHYIATVGGSGVPRDVAEANAAFIVKASNSYEALVAACRLTARHFTRMAASDQFMGDDEHEAWTALEAALALAEGRPLTEQEKR